MANGPAPRRMDPWHLWSDHEHAPAWNMAADEVLLRTVRVRGRPLLRIYDWDRPAATIGYFQPASRGDETGLAWVRRTTGGGIVLHDRDQTYTVVIPPDDPRVESGTTDAYRTFNRCVARALADLGVEGQLSSQPLPRHTDLRTMVCFAQPTRYDVLADGRKVAGAAQRRTRDGILHQGSVRIDVPGMDRDAFRARLVSAFKEELAASFDDFRPDNGFVDAVAELSANRYDNDAWNRQR